ncbi:ATP-binding cassette, subfamily F, member 3 [Verrucomicrobium sp. GAS474]|uniref:ABC-F family ATP-binding cassette domain-containing protein n=1 Tax=Verrucomicrobium sp. GAS474 TaxID=1882831 RepID=UPI00087C1CEB|nr:ABC-F family ATP-binding cassette domain-containing protein [Verrucomicrobium sp. GAS474]SDU15474.1 ATP-binding cassette, subfamily F, member 3 [Verrucomicrobium sp. GAS474]
MLTLSGVSKSYGSRTLFEDVSLQINVGERIAIVGPNGAGKSTLFSLILGLNEPDDGTIVREKGTTLGFLPQETAPVGEETILQLATAITPEIGRLQKVILEWETEGKGSEDAYHDALGLFSELGGHALEPKAKRILSGLAFRDADFDKPARTMSGGWVMRAHLARLLVMEPDLLMLDEPTNHLDLESVGWFRNYLMGYPGAILMISHDRDFLNQLTEAVVAVAHGRLKRYRGNYDDYVVQKAADEERQLAAYKNQQKEIERLQDFADRFRAKASKASQAQSKLKQIERMEKIEAPLGTEKTIGFRFPQPKPSGQRVITLKNVDHAYGDHVVYKDLNFEVEKEERIVLVGPNGAGKSTMLKLLSGALPVQAGLRELGHNTKVGYFSQNRVEMLNSKRTVMEEILTCEKPVSEQVARTVLGSFLFRGDDAFKRISVLSGGEKSRLALVKLLLDPPNLLLMDEPTTHLDMGSIDAMIEALKQFSGTLIFISHDVYFIRALAKSVVHIHGGKPVRYAGDYQYYLDKSGAVSEKAALVAGGIGENARPEAPAEAKKQDGPSVFKTKEQKRAEAEARQARSKVKKEVEARLVAVEKEIAYLEAQQAELTALMADTANYDANGGGAEISRKLSETGATLNQKISEWDKVTAEMAELTGHAA